MDKNEFFREATIRICGDLNIEKALFSTLIYLRRTMPVDIMFLQYFDRSINAMRTLAKATPKAGESLDLVKPVSDETIKETREKYHTDSRKAYFIEDPLKMRLAKEMLEFHKVKATSLLLIRLELGNQTIGSLVIIATGDEKLSPLQIEYLSLISDPFAIALSNTIKHREVIKLKDQLADDNKYLHQELRNISGCEIIGANYGLKDAMQKVQQIVNLESPVLLLGETGVGKDVIASAIHYSSLRSNGPFISVNCGAIPESLIDSELFGHEKGAFTGAISQKRGRFERADRGTIFLDEIGELPLQAQVRLLRVLQHKEFERVGGTETISPDIRIIAATNRDLEQMVANKNFREDLWFRLSVFPIFIPPLRARKNDIPELIQYFIELKSVELKLPKTPVLKDEAIKVLSNYSWPGNVRELQNVVERELILNPSGPLEFNHFLMQRDNHEFTQKINQNSIVETNIADLDSVISNHIEKILKLTQGRIHGKGGAAKLLGINASTLRNRMNKLGIKYRKNELYK